MNPNYIYCKLFYIQQIILTFQRKYFGTYYFEVDKECKYFKITFYQGRIIVDFRKSVKSLRKPRRKQN